MLSVSDNYQIGPNTQQDISIISKDAEPVVSIPPVVNGQGVADHVDINQQNPNPNPATVVLSAPVVDPDQPAPSFYEVMATLKQHMQASALASLDATQALNQKLGDARLAELNQAIEAVNVAKDNLQNANQDLADKNQQLADAQSNLAGKSYQLEVAQSKLEKDLAYQQIAEADSQKYPDDVLRRDKAGAAKATVEQSTQALAAAQSENTVATESMTQAAAVAVAAAEYAVNAQKEATDCTENLVNATNSTPEVVAAAAQEFKTALAILMECMAKLTMLLNKYTQEKLDSDLALFQTTQQKLADELVEEAKKYENAVNGADTAQKWKKIAGRVAGIFVIALSGAAAVASGGALSIVVVLAVTAVMATDMGLEETGHKTLTAMAMDPVMKGLTQAIAESIKKNHPGCSDEKAQTWASICTVVIVVAAVALITKGGGMAKNAMANGTSTFSTSFKTFLESCSKFCLSGSPNLAGAARAGSILQGATAGMGVIDAGMQMGGSIISGMAEQDKSEADAATTIKTALLAIIKTLIEGSVDQFCKSNESFELNKHLSEWITQNQTTIAGISGNIRA